MLSLAVPKFLFFLVPSVIALLAIRKLRVRKWGSCTNTVKLNGKVAIVTGANSGIGYEIAKELAARNAKVILACRNVKSAQTAIKRITEELTTKGLDLVALELDLASLQSVKKFAETVIEQCPQINLLINNAGVSYPKREMHQTEDGFEAHFGVNHLGHFYLTTLLLDKLKNSAPSRIIIVSSSLHERGQIVNDEKLDLKAPLNLYASSKLANIYFCQELANRLQGSGVAVYALCPGWVYTNLFRYSIKWYHYILVLPIAFFFMRGARQGAQTAIYCATDPDLAKESGLLYRDCKIYKSRKEFSERERLELWDKSEALIRQKMGNV